MKCRAHNTVSSACVACASPVTPHILVCLHRAAVSLRVGMRGVDPLPMCFTNAQRVAVHVAHHVQALVRSVIEASRVAVSSAAALAGLRAAYARTSSALEALRAEHESLQASTRLCFEAAKGGFRGVLCLAVRAPWAWACLKCRQRLGTLRWDLLWGHCSRYHAACVKHGTWDGRNRDNDALCASVSCTAAWLQAEDVRLRDRLALLESLVGATGAGAGGGINILGGGGTGSGGGDDGGGGGAYTASTAAFIELEELRRWATGHFKGNDAGNGTGKATRFPIRRTTTALYRNDVNAGVCTVHVLTHAYVDTWCAGRMLCCTSGFSCWTPGGLRRRHLTHQAAAAVLACWAAPVGRQAAAGRRGGRAQARQEACRRVARPHTRLRTRPHLAG